MDTKKDKRTRNWAMIVYPDSAPENWREILGELHIPWVASPLHNKDKNPDGTLKKPHWHVILTFENKKAYHQIKEITDKLNAPIPQPCESLRGYVRYLVHTDNPEKYQYDRSKIENHGVDDIDKYFETISSQREILKEIVIFINDNKITKVKELSEYAIAQHKDDWFDVISRKNTYFLRTLCDDMYQQLKQEDKEKAEAATEAETLREMDSDDSPANKMERALKAKNMAKRGYTRREIADTLGVSERTVRRFITGK